MKDLYVIGNGFDIHHGIPSSYKMFRKWLKENNYGLLLKMEEILGDCGNEWWNEFETSLGKVDLVKGYTEEVAFENRPNIASEEFRDRDWDNARYEVEERLGSLIEDLKDEFRLWASQLSPFDDWKTVRINKEDAFFLTFNYSLTLENLYEIPSKRILHIHGSVLDKKSIVVGHGRSYDDIRQELNDAPPEPPKDVDNEELQDWYEQECAELADDYSTQAAKDSAASAIYSIHKDVDGIIARHSGFFDSLKDVERLHIYGFSFSGIDLPYLRTIFEKADCDSLFVEISWLTDKDIDRIMRFMKACPKVKELRLIQLNDILLNSSTGLFEDNLRP